VVKVLYITSEDDVTEVKMSRAPSLATLHVVAAAPVPEEGAEGLDPPPRGRNRNRSRVLSSASPSPSRPLE
jgi:hypothetical protein